MESRIEELEKELKAARKAYYNLNPIISDQEYDAKKDELERLCPKSKEVTTIGAEPATHTVWQKEAHEIPMGSLNKVNSKDEFHNWCITTSYNEFVITYKLDGVSLSVTYDNGKLQKAIMRGNGIIGENITANAVQIPNLPKEIPITTERVTVRGEVLMKKDVFEEKYAAEYANPRNTTSGKIRDKKNGGKDCQNLSFIAFALSSDSAPDTERNRLRVLKAMGFETPHWETGTAEKMEAEHQKMADARDSMNFGVDGTVIKVNHIPTQESLGGVGTRPKGQIAWKFDPKMAVSHVLDIKWQVGLTGRVTPVAVVEPVSIDGVTISNVSLHNIKMFRELKLWKGCEVLIVRRNDVIPYLQANLELDK